MVEGHWRRRGSQWPSAKEVVSCTEGAGISQKNPESVKQDRRGPKRKGACWRRLFDPGAQEKETPRAAGDENVINALIVLLLDQSSKMWRQFDAHWTMDQIHLEANIGEKRSLRVDTDRRLRINFVISKELQLGLTVHVSFNTQISRSFVATMQNSI